MGFIIAVLAILSSAGFLYFLGKSDDSRGSKDKDN